MNMKTHKTKSSRILKNFEKKLRKAIINDPFLNKTIRVRRNGYELEYKVEKLDVIDRSLFYEGHITSSSESCPFTTGDAFELSANEIKYHTVLNK